MGTYAVLGHPHPTRRLAARAALLAAGVTLLMIASSASAAALSGPGSAGSAIAPLGTGSQSHVPVLSGAQIAAAPKVQAVSTPLTNAPLDRVLGAVPASQNVTFTVGFQLRDPQGLANIISAEETPGSPLFQHWLTSAQEMQMFGPDPTVVQDTIAYYTAMGFHVTTQGPISIGFTGTAAQVDSAFATELSLVQNGSGAPQVMNSLPISLPQPLAGSISTVNGFEGGTIFQPTLVFNPTLEPSDLSSSAAPDASVSASAGTDITTNESEAYNYTNAAFYWFRFFDHFYNKYVDYQVVSPASLNTMLDASPLLAQGYNGNASGNTQITIAIVMAGGINPGDIQSYGRMVWNNPGQLWDRITPVEVDRTSGLNGTTTYTDGGSNEMALDIEYSGTMAPGAKIEPVYGPCLCTNVLDDDYAAIDALGHLPNIISNSWGASEEGMLFGGGSLTGPSWENFDVMNNYFELLTARGATILASSGDGGGIDTSVGVLSGSFPATDPYVLAVNGIRTSWANATGNPYPNPGNIGVMNMTEFEGSSPDVPPNWPATVNTAQTIHGFSYWYTPLLNTTLYTAVPIASGGFGTSYWFNQSWTEHGLGVPDVGRSLGSGVSAEADFNESIYFDGSFETGYGGTSFACPTTAGMLADIEDYLEAHGHSAYLGNGNGPVYWVGNAWENRNLTLDPFFDVTNGTSYWGNHGVENGWQWPGGQVFPRDANGHIDYGNTTAGWDFPSGWGIIDVDHFAQDLEHLEDLGGSVTTSNPNAWGNLATNNTYQFSIAESSSLSASHPILSVEFFPKDQLTSEVGAPTTYYPAVAPNDTFTLNLGNPTGIDGPGLLVFTLGNQSTSSAAFEYDWVSWALPTGGSLAVNVVFPTGGQVVGGQATFGPKIGNYDPPVTGPASGFNAVNLVIVRVTYNGLGVYNARVSGTVNSPYDLAFEGSRALNVSQSYGNAHTTLSDTISTSFTNLTGYAYVWTDNVIAPTNLFINATYSTEFAETNISMVPPPNIQLKDNFGNGATPTGGFSGFNWVAYLLWDTHQAVNQRAEQIWAPNSVNQSEYYTLGYTYAGELLKVNVNDYQGNPMGGVKVWFGNWDTGTATRFNYYEPTFGAVGTANASGSTGTTNSDGVATILIPQNESVDASDGLYGEPLNTYDGPAASALISADISGESNVTFQTAQSCEAPNAISPVLVNCDYNDSIQRNYTSMNVLVMPDPVHAWTQTPSGVQRSFFSTGTNVSFGFNVTLPSNDPLINYYGFNWAPNLFHVTNATVYLDNDPNPVGAVSPEVDNQLQFFTAHGNLTDHHIANGTHTLTVEVGTSSGQTFTYTAKFVVGAVQFDDLNLTNTYTQVPYPLNWTINIPSNEINNHTFSQSLEVQYVTGGCSGLLNPCPTVVNLTEKVRPGIQQYSQLINLTMLQKDNFYSGAGGLPSGQYLLTLWLNANHSGNVTAQLPTYLVFSDLNGSFTGPTNNEQVPLGNITISYTYTGGYLSNATLFVFSATAPSSPVFSQGIFVPAIGSNPRGGSVTWYATLHGTYRLVMDLGTPYTHTNITEWINVTLFANVIYINQTHVASGALGGMSAASVGTVIAIIGAILGFLVGLFAAPAFRGAPSGTSTTRPTAQWEELGGQTPGGHVECPVCHEHFSTPYALHAHQKTAHGIEE